MNELGRLASCFAGLVAFSACPGPRSPQTPPVASSTVALGRDGFSLRGVAGDGDLTFAALASTVTTDPVAAITGDSLSTGGTTSASSAVRPPSNLAAGGAATGSGTTAAKTSGGATSTGGAASTGGARSVVEARRGDRLVWSTPLSGTAGAVTRAGELVVVGLAARGTLTAGDASDGVGVLPDRVGVSSSGDVGRQRNNLLGITPASGGGGGPRDKLLGTAPASGGGGRRDNLLGIMPASGGRRDNLLGITPASGGVRSSRNLAVGPASTGAGTSTGASTSTSAGRSIAMRGDPGSILAALDRKTGALRWRLAFDASEWSLISSIAEAGNDVIVGGSFAGSLRVGTRVVTSAGVGDGFVARVTATGALAWLVRTGGVGPDGVQGVAVAGERIAIAGTFAAGADLLGEPLHAYDDRSQFCDAFVAELDAKGGRRWQQTFGGRGDDTVAGVAIDADGNFVVAANAREVVGVGSTQLVTSGPSDGVLVWYGAGGEKGTAILVGGLDYDGLRGIAAAGSSIVVGGFYSGKIKLAERELAAGGGDDAFLATYDASGTVGTSWHVGGAGREEITALSSIPGGFIAGVAHTAAATVEDAALAAPRDPMTGAALVVRGAR